MSIHCPRTVSSTVPGCGTSLEEHLQHGDQILPGVEPVRVGTEARIIGRPDARDLAEPMKRRIVSCSQDDLVDHLRT